MNKEAARYIFYCMQKDSAYRYGVNDWCEDRDIKEDDYLQFEAMVHEMINNLED